ncbi:hypothetical protein Asppvi_009009 [Aspergillus pseudoviridinutans]|uniref:Uncharacterized protein n=1 Tax=Aspergillus pseudoviridinutans TaxID=1517512 RepID=A0A9P3BIQ1_9EURO|nr:uncharacterized protein Asppvi_009009 [Aspergillus pseudoviridinutans]GIJ90060.1 hypothetical protein Asppvi_009009 [Aspergillus pseudoviridinutans]
MANARLSFELRKETRESIVSQFWGQYMQSISSDILKERWIAEQEGILKDYFKYYHDQVAIQDPLRSPGTLKTHKELFFFTDLLKQNADIPRTELTAACEMVYGSRPYSGCVMLTEGLRNLLARCSRAGRRINFDSALALAVRVLFAVNIPSTSQPRRNRMVVGQSNLVWAGRYSLREFLDDTFPMSEQTLGSGLVKIKRTKLRARFLENHADIEIEWTKHLPDHLKLETTGNRKILQIFELVSFLQVSYNATCAEDFNLPTSESIRLGCYRPRFLWETLKTMQLLFPPGDWNWLKSKKENYKQLRCHFEDWHGKDVNLRALTGAQLLRTYPYWAVRLEILYQEAEDPTPVSCLGRWAERRKAAWHSYLVAFWAIVIAVFFGLAATALSAVQTWITYQAWKHPINSSQT